MKKLACLILLLICVTTINAQRTDTIKSIPHYKVLTKDSTYITDANLKKGKPVMIIYFAPDCSHCQQLTYEFQDEFKKEAKKHSNTLKHVQIMMITWQQIKAIQAFYKDFGLEKYPNITVGTEGNTMTLLHFYKVTTTPYIAIYSKNGQLTKAFEKVPKFEEIIAELKKV